jgi:hypothetical protein
VSDAFSLRAGPALDAGCLASRADRRTFGNRRAQDEHEFELAGIIK